MSSDFDVPGMLPVPNQGSPILGRVNDGPQTAETMVDHMYQLIRAERPKCDQLFACRLQCLL